MRQILPLIRNEHKIGVITAYLGMTELEMAAVIGASENRIRRWKKRGMQGDGVHALIHDLSRVLGVEHEYLWEPD